MLEEPDVDVNIIARDIEDIRKQHKEFMEKHNGIVCFGLAGDHTDW